MRTQFEDLPDFSLETLRLIMLRKIRASFKLVSKMNLRFTRAQDVISLARISRLVEVMQKQEVELIFFDELSINSHFQKLMVGELKEEKFALCTRSPHKGFSVIVGFSQYRYFGVMATDKTFNSS